MLYYYPVRWNISPKSLILKIRTHIPYYYCSLTYNTLICPLDKICSDNP